MRGIAIALAAGLLLGAGAPPVSDLKDDEIIIFYPSSLTRESPEGPWRGRIHGMVQEPDDGASASVKRAALRAVLRLHDELTPEGEELFRSRAAEFLADTERDKTIVVRVKGRSFVSEPSLAGGHFHVSVELAVGEAGDRLSFQAVLGGDDSREFRGTLRLIAPEGVSVISDIDDTVKISGVGDRDELLANTFLRPYRAVEGLAGLYAGWDEQKVAVHYVTGSPWQLYPALWSFLEEEGFPGDEIQMRDLRLKDSSAIDFFGEPQRYKIGRIRQILQRLPGRSFVLVGDSGEQDPEIYASIAEEFPEQVRGIFIRAVHDDHASRERYRETFALLAASSWIVFREAGALPEDLAEWIRKTHRLDP